MSGSGSVDVYDFFNAEFAVRRRHHRVQLFPAGGAWAELLLIQDESQVLPEHPAAGDGFGNISEGLSL
jgi:hypothetical protein